MVRTNEIARSVNIPEPIKHTNISVFYAVKFHLGIRLGSASVCHDKTSFQQVFVEQLQDLPTSSGWDLGMRLRDYKFTWFEIVIKYS